MPHLGGTLDPDIEPRLRYNIDGSPSDLFVHAQEIRDGGVTLQISLVSPHHWETGATFNSGRQGIIDSFNGDGSDPTNWNTAVRDVSVVTDVVRTSDSLVTYTLPVAATYDWDDWSFNAQEQVTNAAPFPLDAVVGADAARWPSPYPYVEIEPTPGDNEGIFYIQPTIIDISGTVHSTVGEEDIVAGSETIIIDLTNDTWVAAGATFDAQRQNIINGLDSAESELNGWNNEVRDQEVVTAVVRTNDTRVTITLSAAGSYDITSQETITVTVPDTALVTTGIDRVGLSEDDFTVIPFSATGEVGGGGSFIKKLRNRARRGRR